MCQEARLVASSGVKDQKAEAQRGKGTSPGSHSLSVDQLAFGDASPPISKHRLVFRWEGTPLCALTSLLPRPREQDANYLFKKESEDQSLTQLPASRRLAHPFHPPHFPPSPPAAPAPASTQLAFSSRGSGELFGSPGRAAEAMEASAGNDRDPGDLRAHRPAARASAQSAKYGMGGGEARTARRSGRSARQAA